MFSKLILEIKAQALPAEIHEQCRFQKFFVDRDGVALVVLHRGRKDDEYFVFRSFDEMAECASTRPYIPMSEWDELAELLHLTQACHALPHR